MKESRYACADRRPKRMVAVYRGIPGRIILCRGALFLMEIMKVVDVSAGVKSCFLSKNERIALA